MELEPARFHFKPDADSRPRIPQPPVVRLQAIEDARLNAPHGLERQLDAFYVGLLRFERDADAGETIAYRAQKWRVVFNIVERMPDRTDYRPVYCDLPQLPDLVAALNENEITFEWQKGISAGTDRVLIRDPAGNYVSVGGIGEIQ